MTEYWTEYFEILDRQAISDENMKTIQLQGAQVQYQQKQNIKLLLTHPVSFDTGDNSKTVRSQKVGFRTYEKQHFSQIQKVNWTFLHKGSVSETLRLVLLRREMDKEVELYLKSIFLKNVLAKTTEI